MSIFQKVTDFFWPMDYSTYSENVFLRLSENLGHLPILAMLHALVQAVHFPYSLVPYHLMLAFIDLEGPVLILYLPNVLLNSKNYYFPSSYFYSLCVCVLLLHSFIHSTKKICI